MAVKRKSQKRKHLTAKQVKYFGTKAQKAALKRKRSVSQPKRKASVKKSTKKKTTRKAPASSTNWLATAAAGLGGLGVGAAGGVLFSDQIKGLLSKIPVVGSFFGNGTQVTSPADAAMQGKPWIAAGESEEDWMGEHFPDPRIQKEIADLSAGMWTNSPQPVLEGTTSEVYQDYWNQY